MMMISENHNSHRSMWQQVSTEELSFGLSIYSQVCGMTFKSEYLGKFEFIFEKNLGLNQRSSGLY